MTLKRLPEPRPLPSSGGSRRDPCAACAVRVLSVCEAIDDRDLDCLAAIVSSHRVAAHKTFVMEGDPADALFNITDGAVKLYKSLADGRQQITGFLFAGDFLGLSSSDCYAHSAEAVTEVGYCRFPRRQFEMLLAKFPQMEHRLLGIASNELAAAQEQMLLLGRKSAREKLASFLLMLSRHAERTGGPPSPFLLPMTRSDIADYLGLTVETVSRTFTKFKRDGLVRLHNNTEVDLTDHEALAAVADAM
jgi:CRP/FNR family transcriptional regulator